MLPEPTDVIPTRKPANSPIPDIPANDFRVGGRPATCSSILDCNSNNVDMQTNNDTHHQPDHNLGRKFHYALLSRGRSRINANESLALQMQNDLLGGFFGRQIRGVDDYLGIFWLLIRI